MEASLVLSVGAEKELDEVGFITERFMRAQGDLEGVTELLEARGIARMGETEKSPGLSSKWKAWLTSVANNLRFTNGQRRSKIG